MKTFKQLLSETDLRFGTPEDPRLNIHDPLYDTTSAYDPEHAKIMRAVAGSDADTINTNARGGGRSGRLANEVVPFPDAENVPHRDTFHSFKPMTQAEVAKHLGYKDRQGASALEFAALKKLLAGLQNDEKIKDLFAAMTKDKNLSEETKRKIEYLKLDQRSIDKLHSNLSEQEREMFSNMIDPESHVPVLIQQRKALERIHAERRKVS